jgi:sulfoxide reductase heme-binding subunit YedZ
MKPLTLLALAGPGVYVALQWTLGLAGLPNELGFNPAEWTHHFLGDTALRILLVTLAISPLRDLTGWAPLALIRRRIGLAAFLYSAAHIIAYLWLDLLWSLPALWEDVLKRTYITLGMAAFAAMIPLALTSTNGMIRKIGRKSWERLHTLIFPLAILSVLHHLFMVKGNQPEPLVHGAILLVLLAWRGFRRLRPGDRAASA